jgi:TPR repeat protein/WD40 repeat protein
MRTAQAAITASLIVATGFAQTVAPPPREPPSSNTPALVSVQLPPNASLYEQFLRKAGDASLDVTTQRRMLAALVADYLDEPEQARVVETISALVNGSADLATSVAAFDAIVGPIARRALESLSSSDDLWARYFLASAYSARPTSGATQPFEAWAFPPEARPFWLARQRVLLGRDFASDDARAIALLKDLTVQKHAPSLALLATIYRDAVAGVKRDAEEAFRLSRAAAALEHPAALTGLAHLYLYGIGTAVDDSAAVSLLRKAADAGAAAGMAWLGWCYENGRGVGADPAIAATWYAKAAALREPFSARRLGEMYAAGEGVTTDMSRALHFHRLGALSGDTTAMRNLAAFYESGPKETRDLGVTLTWIRLAAQLGDIVAMDGLGWGYELGVGLAKDEKLAAEWYRKAADRGSTVAMNGLGALYADGRGVEKNAAEAERWFRRAAEAGHSRAMTNLAAQYATGTQALGKDLRQAFRWYRRAAELGDAHAMERAGRHYLLGVGTARDDAAAIRWLTRAAEASDVEAARLLGLMYESGLGVIKDPIEARRWYAKAAEASPDAAEELRKLDENVVPPVAGVELAHARYRGDVLARGRGFRPGPTDAAGSIPPEIVTHTPPLVLINNLAISRDAAWFVAASFGSMTIYDARSGQPLRSIPLGMTVTDAAVVSADGEWIVAAVQGGTEAARRWNVRSGRVGDPFERGSMGSVFDLAVSADGRWLAGCSPGKIGIWDAASGRLVRIATLPEETSAQARSDGQGYLAFAPDGTWLVAGHGNGSVYRIDVATGTTRAIYKHDQPIERVAIAADGRTVASSDTSHGLRVWKNTNGSGVPVTVETPPDTPHTVLGFASTGDLITESLDAFVVWNTERLRPTKRVETEPASRSAVDIDPSGRFVVGVHFPVRNMALMAQGTFAFDLSVWDLVGHREVPAHHVTARIDAPSLLTPDRGTLLMPTALGGLKVWDIPSGRLVRHLDTAGLTGAALTADGRTLVTVAHDGYVQRWNAETWTSDRPVHTGLKGVLAVFMDASPDGGLLAVPNGTTIGLWDVWTGARIGELTGHTGTQARALFLNDGELATLGDRTVRFWDVQALAERRDKRVELPVDVGLIATRGASGRTLLVSDKQGIVREIDPAVGVVREVVRANQELSALALSADGALLAASSQSGGVQVWETASGKLVAAFELGSLTHGLHWVRPDVIVAGSVGGSIEVLTLSNLSARTHVRSNANGLEWVVVSNSGFFDGTPGAWRDLLWRFGGDTFDVAPVEAYFNEFYRPGLLAEVLSGRSPKPPVAITTRDRRSPALTIEPRGASAAGAIASRTVTLRVTAAEAPPGGSYTRGGGVKDLRLFRNGSLVRVWRGDVVKPGGRPRILDVDVPLVEGENRFSIYAFNRDSVKSTDASVTLTGGRALRRRGTLYVLAIGIDQYANREFNLKYAVADAGAAAGEIAAQQRRLGLYERVEVVPLYDRDATKANIIASLRALAGQPLPRVAPQQLKQLSAAQPEDAVIIYYAGHGTAARSTFYLIPHDVAYTGQFPAVTAAEVSALLGNSVADTEIGTAVEGIDAGHLVLVIDACNSGQALEAEDRIGPMNSKGLAQLAYEKGMYVLAAAQGTQAAQEVVTLGHGLLTYALVIEGIRRGEAAQEGIVDTASWFDYAVRRVPELQRSELARAQREGRQVRFVNGRPRGIGEDDLQRPRAYYRDRRQDDPLILGRRY